MSIPLLRGDCLKLKVVKKDKNFLEMFLEGEEHSFPNLLRETLLEDDDVEFASYVIEHPQVGSPKLIVRTKSKTPESAIKSALKKIEKRASDFEALLKKK